MKKIHVTILALAMVMLPPWFLVFTEEGAKITDNVVLWFWGTDSLEMNVRELDQDFSREQIRQVFPELDWQCREQGSDFGDSLCAAAIGTFNQFPSRYITFFFATDRLNAVKLVYRKPYHEQVLGHLLQQLGQPLNMEDAMLDGPDTDVLLQWDTGKGRLVMKKSLLDGDEAALVWIAMPVGP